MFARTVTLLGLRAGRGGAVLALAAGLAVGSAAGCGGERPAPAQTSASGAGSPSAVSSQGKPRKLTNDDDVREAVRQGLLSEDHLKAGLTAMRSSMVREVSVPLPKSWRFFRFDTVPDPQASFQVALETATGKVVSLTDSPEAFTRVVQGSGGAVRSEAEAAALARSFVELTRPMTELVVVLEDSEDIELRPSATGKEKKAREKAVKKLRSVVRPPGASAQGDGFTATLFVQAGARVEERTVTIDAGGTVTGRSKVLADGIPRV